MNKMKVLVIAAILMISAGSAMAQKTGYISMDQVVGLMPETAKLDTVLQKYQSDSLNPRYAYTLSEFQRKDSIVNGKDSLKTPAAVRAKMRQEMQQDIYELQNWQQIVQNAMQEKQQELLEPIYRKAVTAIQDVAKASGYTYVYSREAILVAPPADDLLPLVAKKLNIKLPAGATAGTQAAGATTVPKK
jgi:outer membrane protein